MWDQVGQLHAYHGDVPVEIRLLKLTEEVGEVADAFLGVHGLNKRKASAGPVRTCSTNSPT
jgi:NTP pyrophosphatase (non-canonical NTP hydrolase)